MWPSNILSHFVSREIIIYRIIINLKVTSCVFGSPGLNHMAVRSLTTRKLEEAGLREGLYRAMTNT